MTTVEHRHRPICVAAVLALVLTGPALGQSELQGQTLGTTIGQVASRLEAMGYFVTEAELEDGRIETEILIDGTEWELRIDAATGIVTRVEEDD